MHMNESSVLTEKDFKGIITVNVFIVNLLFVDLVITNLLIHGVEIRFYTVSKILIIG